MANCDSSLRTERGPRFCWSGCAWPVALNAPSYGSRNIGDGYIPVIRGGQRRFFSGGDRCSGGSDRSCIRFIGSSGRAFHRRAGTRSSHGVWCLWQPGHDRIPAVDGCGVWSLELSSNGCVAGIETLKRGPQRSHCCRPFRPGQRATGGAGTVSHQRCGRAVLLAARQHLADGHRGGGQDQHGYARLVTSIAKNDLPYERFRRTGNREWLWSPGNRLGTQGCARLAILGGSGAACSGSGTWLFTI